MNEQFQNLENQLAILESDPSADPHQKIDVMNELAWELRNFDPHRALTLSDTAYGLAQSHVYPRGQLYSFRNLTALNTYIFTKHDIALGWANRALSLLETCPDELAQAHVLECMGLIYVELGDFSAAHTHMVQALALCRQAGDQQTESMLLNDLGGLYHDAHDFDHGLELLEQALKISQTIGDQEMQARMMNNIGDLLNHKGHYEEAFPYLERSLAITRQLGIKTLEPAVLDSLSEVHAARGDYAQALARLDQAYRLAEEFDNKLKQSEFLRNMARVYQRQQKTGAALDYLHRALTMAETVETKLEVFACHQLLAQIYEIRREPDKALFHYKQYFSLKEAVFNEKTAEKFKTLQVIYETETAKREAKIHRLKNMELEREIARRKSAQAEAQNRAKEMTALAEVSREISALLDLPFVLKKIASLAKKLLQATTIAILMRQADGETFLPTVVLGHRASQIKTGRVMLGQGISGHIAQTGVAEIVHHTSQDPRALHIPRTPTVDVEMETMMCAPFNYQDKITGLIMLWRNPEIGQFTAADLSFLTSLAQQVASGIENARLFEAEQRARQELLLKLQESFILNHALQTISHTANLTESLEVVANILVHLLNARNCGITLLNEDGAELEVVVSVSTDITYPSTVGIRIPLADNPSSSQVIETRQSLVIEKAQEDPLTGSIHAIMRRLNTQCLMIVPLLARGEVIGTIGVDTDQPGSVFSPEEVQLVETMAGQIAGAIGMTRLFEKEQQAKKAADEARREAEIANQAKSVFLATMSHELRTPLNAILGFAQILQRDSHTTPDQRQDLTTIEQSGKHLLTLINDTLDLAKVEAGRLDLYPSQFNLPGMLAELNSMIQVRANPKGLNLKVEPDNLPPYVFGDERRLREVLLNLLDNAVKYTPQGRVLLRVNLVEYSKTRPPAARIRFSVEDTGIGIPANALDTIFDPFEQIEAAANRMSGTGLGLAISRNLVKLMGGSLQVESVLGQGSTFWFELTLPVAGEPSLSPDQKWGNIVGVAGTAPTVLVVDDSQLNRRFLTRFLQSIGFTVIEAVDGTEGLALIETNPPDLVITDVVMPEMNGLELIRQVRRQPALQKLPIIATSASVFAEDRRQSLAAGSNAFLAKPIAFDELLEQLQRLLDHDWVYEDSPPPPAAEEALDPLLTPPADEITALYELTRQGDIGGLRNRVERLMEIEEGRYRQFALKLHGLIRQFAINNIQIFLQTCADIQTTAEQKNEAS